MVYCKKEADDKCIHVHVCIIYKYVMGFGVLSGSKVPALPLDQGSSTPLGKVPAERAKVPVCQTHLLGYLHVPFSLSSHRAHVLVFTST